MEQLYELLVILLVVPVQRLMLYLWSRLVQTPTKNQLDVLHQMASKLHVPEISRVILRPNVVMFKDASSVEVIHKAARALSTLVE